MIRTLKILPGDLTHFTQWLLRPWGGIEGINSGARKKMKEKEGSLKCLTAARRNHMIVQVSSIWLKTETEVTSKAKKHACSEHAQVDKL